MPVNLRHKFTDSELFRPLAYSLLSSGVITRNPAYRFIYSGRIRSIQRRGVVHPLTVAIEGTNVCNSSCVMCGHKNMQRPKGVMAIDLYENILGQIKDWPIENLLLSGFGEPLLDPLLEKRISLAKANGLRNVGLVTNASLLSPEKSAGLISSGLDFIHVSLDGASRETYQKLRPGLDYETVISNLDHMLSMPGRPKVFIQVVVLDENKGEIATLRQTWAGKADRLIFRQAQDWAGQTSLPGRSSSPHLTDRSQWPPCRYLWDQLNVYWNGVVPACCLDYEARQIIGNAGRQSLHDIWNGTELSDMRLKHNAGQRDKVSLCRRCRYFSIWW